MENKVLTIQNKLIEPLSADKNQRFPNVYKLLFTDICNFGPLLLENLLLPNLASFCVTLGVWLSIFVHERKLAIDCLVFLNYFFA